MLGDASCIISNQFTVWMVQINISLQIPQLEANMDITFVFIYVQKLKIHSSHEAYPSGNVCQIH